MTDPAAQRTHLDAVVATGTYLALSAYLLGASLFIRMAMPIRIGYALCALAATLMPAMLMLAGRRPPTNVVRIAAVVVGVALVYLIPAASFPDGRTMLHVAVDFATLVVPIGFLVAGSMAAPLFRSILDPRWVLFFFLVSLYAPFVAQDPTPARLFEPPSVGIIALLATLAIIGSSKTPRVAAAIGLAVLSALALLSGSRSIVVLAVAAFILATLANRTARWVAVTTAAAVVLMLFVGNPTAGWRAVRDSAVLRSASRIAGLLRPAGDEAVGLRVKEATLIWQDMQQHPAWIPLGVGHGAVFVPERPFPEHNISADGYVHNVHIGPLLMLFRYGLVGLAMYVLLALRAGITTVLTFRRRGDPAADPAPFFYAFGTFLYLVEFLARNVLPNPMFSFVLAGYVATVLGAPASPSDHHPPTDNLP